MNAGIKKAINYAVGIIVVAGLAYYLLVPMAPARIVYTTLTSARSVPATFYLTAPSATIGKSADIVPVGTTPLVAATITGTSSNGGATAWTIASSDASTVVTVNGQAAGATPLSDGAAIQVGAAKLTYFAGRAGFAGFLDRLESDPTAHIFMSPTVIGGAFPIVARAFPASVAFGVLGFLFAIPFGLILSFMKMARTRWLRFPATLYVDVVRGTPLFLQILVVVFAIPLLPAYKDLLIAAPWLGNAGPLNISYTYWMRGLVVLSFNSAAYMAEIFRAGIQSISKGQSEAARSLGMTAVQSMAFVILPQTVRRILPTMMSEFILLFKDTAMLSAVGVAEMVQRAREVAASTFNTSSYLVAAGFYLLLTVPLGRLVQNLENRLAVSEGAGGAEAEQEPGDEPARLAPELLIAEKIVVPGAAPDGSHREGGRR